MNRMNGTGIFLIVFIMISGCGGGGGNAPVNTPPSDIGSGRVTIADQAYDGKNASATISGTAFISPTWWGCNTTGCVSGVTVTCQNVTMGITVTVEPKMNCVLSICTNTWSSEVPVIVGSNVIMVTASDPSGNIGYASTTLVRSP